jgi:putative PIN family toxin of toxin-antitoxin system
MRLVLDANVLIAAFVARGFSAELLEYCVREHELVTSDAILEEVRRNLVAKIKVTTSQANQTLELLRTRLDVVEPVALQAPVCRDADDDVVLGTALAGPCDLIVTGDGDLLVLESYQNIPIVSPRGFWIFESQRRSRG